MKSSGAVVTPVSGEGGVAYLSVCEIHREDGRVFRDEAQARRHAQEHNDAHHQGHPPRFHTVDAQRLMPSNHSV